RTQRVQPGADLGRVRLVPDEGQVTGLAPPVALRRRREPGRVGQHEELVRLAQAEVVPGTTAVVVGEEHDELVLGFVPTEQPARVSGPGRTRAPGGAAPRTQAGRSVPGPSPARRAPRPTGARR